MFPGSVTGFYSPEEVADFEPKDMGKPISISEIKSDDLTIDEESGEVAPPTVKGNFAAHVHKLHLYVPGQEEPYATYLSLEDWIEGFLDIFGRIQNSSKYDDKEKTKKYNQLRAANDAFTKTFSGTQTSKFLTKIAEIRRD